MQNEYSPALNSTLNRLAHDISRVASGTDGSYQLTFDAAKVALEKAVSHAPALPPSSPQAALGMREEVRVAVARALAIEHNCPPDALEPGDAYGVDGRMPNGDPAHFNWRRFLHRADKFLTALAPLLAAPVATDTARLDWLEGRNPEFAGNICGTLDKCSLRQAIDAAMSAQEKKL